MIRSSVPLFETESPMNPVRAILSENKSLKFKITQILAEFVRQKVRSRPWNYCLGG